MIALQITLGIVYFIGVIVSFFKVHGWLARRHADGDPEALDALTAMGVGVFWFVWIWPYAIYRLFK